MLGLGVTVCVILTCDICDRPLPDDDTKTDIALWGAKSPCPGCKQPLSKEEITTLISSGKIQKK